MPIGDRPISPRLTSVLSDLATAALQQPAAQHQTHSCQRLLGEAARRRPLRRAAARTIIDIAWDILAQAEPQDQLQMDAA